MKQFIVLMSMVVLGLYLYVCIAGPEGSILSVLKQLWRYELVISPYYGGS